MRIFTVLVLLLAACATQSTNHPVESIGSVAAAQIAHPTTVTVTSPSR